MIDAERQSVLLQLIRGEGQPRDLAGRLRAFDWDSDEELVVLTRLDAVAALRRFRAGELAAGDLEQWADAIEGRDDIGLEAQARSLLSELLFELANPAITEPLTSESAAAWIDRLSEP